MIKAAVIGGSGYIGGELLRLLAMHPEVEITTITSRKYAGKRVEMIHPPLRGSGLRFASPEREIDADVVFLAVPHGESMKIVENYMESSKIVDLSADFRLPLEIYREYYGEHEAPHLIDKFVYGLPEIHREKIRRAEYVANPGCNATAVILALYPFRDTVKEALADIKVSSSAGGRRESLLGMHAERSNVVRLYKGYHHRHEGEVFRETGIRCSFTLHSVDIVRGLLATVYFHMETDEQTLLRKLYQVYGGERFVKVIRERSGVERYPDVKYVIGSNQVHLGVVYDPYAKRVILLSALDNLLKGGAGQAIQNMNIMFNLPETMALEHLPLYPV